MIGRVGGGLSQLLRRAKSDVAPVSKDLNKKILEAFTAIIDKGARNSSLRMEPVLEALPRFNVGSASPVLQSPSLRGKLTLSANAESEAARIQPDIFKRNKMSTKCLYKNVFLMSKMLSASGRMLSRETTKLASKSHRHLSKAVRRARQMGILPYMSRPKVYAYKE